MTIPGILQEMDRCTEKKQSGQPFKPASGTKHCLGSKASLQEITNRENAPNSREISWTKAVDIIAKSKSSSWGQHSLIQLSKEENSMSKPKIEVESGQKNISASSIIQVKRKLDSNFSANSIRDDFQKQQRLSKSSLTDLTDNETSSSYCLVKKRHHGYPKVNSEEVHNSVASTPNDNTRGELPSQANFQKVIKEPPQKVKGNENDLKYKSSVLYYFEKDVETSGTLACKFCGIKLSKISSAYTLISHLQNCNNDVWIKHISNLSQGSPIEEHPTIKSENSQSDSAMLNDITRQEVSNQRYHQQVFYDLEHNRKRKSETNSQPLPRINSPKIEKQMSKKIEHPKTDKRNDATQKYTSSVRYYFEKETGRSGNLTCKFCGIKFSGRISSSDILTNHLQKCNYEVWMKHIAQLSQGLASEQPPQVEYDKLIKFDMASAPSISFIEISKRQQTSTKDISQGETKESDRETETSETNCQGLSNELHHEIIIKAESAKEEIKGTMEVEVTTESDLIKKTQGAGRDSKAKNLAEIIATSSVKEGQNNENFMTGNPITISHSLSVKRAEWDPITGYFQGEKEVFKCNLCPETFPTRENVKKHFLTHTRLDILQKISNTPCLFLCAFCPMKFSEKEHCESHVRSFHTKEKLFQCKYCNEKFATRAICQAHLKTHLQCKHCEMKFKSPHMLEYHMRQSCPVNGTIQY